MKLVAVDDPDTRSSSVAPEVDDVAGDENAVREPTVSGSHLAV
jgi:hypothetical protein